MAARSADPYVRSWAYLGAWKAGAPVDGLAGPMSEDLAHDEFEVVQRTAVALTAIGAEPDEAAKLGGVVPALVALIDSEDEERSELALKVLPNFLGTRVAPETALERLGTEIDRQKLADRLVELLGSSRVSYLAIRVLVVLAPAVRLDVEACLAQAETGRSGATYVAELLGTQGRSVVPALREALVHPNVGRKKAAAGALARIGAEAVDAYDDLFALRSSVSAKAEAIGALVAIAPNRDSTVGVVAGALLNGAPDLVIAVARLVGQCPEDERIDEQLLRYIDPDGRRSVKTKRLDKRSERRLRESVLRGLVERGNTDRRTLEALRDVTVGPNASSYTGAKWILDLIDGATMPDAMLDVMVAAMEAESTSVVSAAVSNVVGRGVADSRIIAAFERAMRRSNGDLTALVVAAIDQLNAVAAIPLVVASLEADEASEARSQWLEARRKDAEKRRRFAYWVLADRMRTSAARAKAALDVGTLGPDSKEIVDALAGVVVEPDRPDPQFGAMAIGLLSRLALTDGLPASLAGVRTNPETIIRSYEPPVVVRTRAAWALGQVSDPALAERASTALMAALEDDSALVRAAAVEALGRLAVRSEEVVPRLVRLLLDDEQPLDVGARVVLALEAHRDVARGALGAMTEDKTRSAKVGALLGEAMGRVGS